MAISLHQEQTTQSFRLSPLVETPAKAKPLLSIICPVHNEDTVLRELYRCTAQVMGELGVGWELILVDDGSNDQSAAQIAHLHDGDERVRGIRFSRKFGFQVAVTAGLDIIGEYLGRMYDGVSERPLYLIEQTWGIDK